MCVRERNMLQVLYSSIFILCACMTAVCGCPKKTVLQNVAAIAGLYNRNKLFFFFFHSQDIPTVCTSHFPSNLWIETPAVRSPAYCENSCSEHTATEAQSGARFFFPTAKSGLDELIELLFNRTQGMNVTGVNYKPRVSPLLASVLIKAGEVVPQIYFHCHILTIQCTTGSKTAL